VLIPSGLVTLASVAIPSLLAKEATARSSSDQQLRAQPGSRAFAAQHHHHHHHHHHITKLQNLHNQVSDSLNFKPQK
jgi:hypothetical protein